MRIHPAIVSVVAAGVQLACSTPAPKQVEKETSSALPPPKITQFYATAPKLQLGEKELLCYGVENAAEVWLSPPRQQLTASLSRCVEVNPTETTQYKITAQGADGQTASQELTVTVGAARAKILEVQVSTLDAARGETVSICYKVSNANSVTIDPINFKAGGGTNQCATHQPRETTTYVVTARGAEGDQDQEKVTVKVH